MAGLNKDSLRPRVDLTEISKEDYSKVSKSILPRSHRTQATLRTWNHDVNVGGELGVVRSDISSSSRRILDGVAQCHALVLSSYRGGRAVAVPTPEDTLMVFKILYV